MQQVGAILRQNAHCVDARVGAVGERKVDNAELATKANRRLGDLLGECPQSAALSSCEEHRDAFFLTHRFLLLSSMFLNPLATGAAQRHARRVMPCWHRGARAPLRVPDLVAVLANGAVAREPATRGGVEQGLAVPGLLVAVAAGELLPRIHVAAEVCHD